MTRVKIVAMVCAVVALGLPATATATAAGASSGNGWQGVTGAARSSRPHPKLQRGGAVDGAGRTGPARPRASTSAGRTLVQVDGDLGSATVAAIARHGGQVLLEGPGAVQADVPDDQLEALSDEGAVRSVHPPHRLRAKASSEGAAAPGAGRLGSSGAAPWQDGSVVGAGTKVAIVDVGFSGYQSLLGSSLPAPVSTINHCGPGTTGFDGSGPSGSEAPDGHGTAVAEIVHAMAPAAQLTLICVYGGNNLEQAVDDMADAGIKLANMSLGDPTEARGDGSGGVGTMSHAVARGRSLGQLWVVAAGNSAVDHAGFTLRDADNDGAYELNDGAPTVGTDPTELYRFTLVPGGWVDEELKWDAWPVANRDVALCYWRGSVSEANLIGCSSDNQSTTPGPPADAVAFSNQTGVSSTYILAVIHAAGTPAGVRGDLYFYGDERNRSFTTAPGSVASPADSPFALSVAAQCFADGRLEPFSSQGPTIDGRAKPDVSGPDGVSTATYGLASPAPAGPGSTACLQGTGGFLGTSASAPHVAGAAALLLSANPALGAAELETILEKRAVAPGASPTPGPGPYAKAQTTGAGQLSLGPLAPVPSRPVPQKLATLDAPSRVLDTRTGTGGPKAPLANGETRAFVLPASVPADASAAVFNVTAVASGAGYLELFPSGSPRPTASNLNYVGGSPIANHVTAAVSPTCCGQVSVSLFNSGGPTEVILDLAGWYSPAGSVGLRTLTVPVRAADTRVGTPTSPRAAPLGPSETFRVPLTAGLGVPAGATAVALNITAVGATRPGWLSVAPAGTTPLASSLNFADGRAVPNLVIAKLGTGGAVDVISGSTGTVHVLVDVAGWFDAGGDGYVATPPIRDLDTRTGTGPHLGALGGSEALDLVVGDRDTVPHDASAVQLNMTAVNESGGGYLTVWPSLLSRPGSSNLNYIPGQVVANGVISRRGVNQAVAIGGSGGRVHVISDVQGYFAGPPAPAPALPAPAAADAPAGSATTYQVNPTHDGHATGTLALSNPGAPRWSHDFGLGTGYPPAVGYPLKVGSRVFVTVNHSPDYGTDVYALDATTGSTLWGPVSLGGTYWFAGLTADSEAVYAINFDGELRALDQVTGQQRWLTDLPGQYAFTSPPTVSGGVVYVGGAGSGSTLYAVNTRTGAVRWSTSSGAAGDHTSPAVADGAVYVSSACEVTQRFDAATGTSGWTTFFGCSGGGGRTSVVHGDSVYVRDDAGMAPRRLSRATGAVLGTFSAAMAPAFDGDLGFFLAPASPSGIWTLSAIDQTTGSVAWSATGDGQLVTAPVVIDGKVIVGSATGQVIALAEQTGAQVWSAGAGAPINRPDEHNAVQTVGLNVADGLLLVPASGRLVAFGG